MDRYSRQTILSEIGPIGQEKLASARVLCIGAGGLGCPALQYLAGAGIGMIGIVDHDHVDISNLQRQTLFTTADSGQPKAEMARKRLLELNPEIEIKAYNEELTDQNVLSLFSGYDIIIDGTDNFAAKFLINDMAVKTGKPVIYGAIQGFDGQVSVFDASRGPCYRCLHPQPPEGVILNCAEAGVIGALAGIIGTMQAMETIKLIVGHASFTPLTGRLWMIDSRSMETRILKIPKGDNCPVCSRPPAEIEVRYSSPVCAATDVVEVACSDPRLTDALMIDVRELEEWEEGHVSEAQHLPLSALTKNPEIYQPPASGKTCVLYCQRGMRSKKAAEILLRAGFTGIYSLKGGYEAWCEERAS